MNKFVNFNLLIEAEKIRYQSDFSGSHWLCQVISKYESCITSYRIREAYENVLRIAIHCGISKAKETSEKYPDICGFPKYLDLKEEDSWNKTKKFVNENWDFHLLNRFGYRRDGD